jgi:hypothetical protein
MGREARCACRWGDARGQVTALLETTEVIVRGEVRARVARASLRDVTVRGGTLTFVAGGKTVELELGAKAAASWAAALSKPLPTLGRKLGITPETRLYVSREPNDENLQAACAEAASTGASIAKADVAIVLAEDGAGVLSWLKSTRSKQRVPPVWIIYVKGRSSPFGETAVRDAMRAAGFMDTKVASVSEALTALRFVRRQAAAGQASSRRASPLLR